MDKYVKKPILSREGANVTIYDGNKVLEETIGSYGSEGYIYQEMFEVPNFEGNYPIIGSWVIGQESAGIGIRESNTKITDNNSRFIPHIII
jgi:glutathionylspermidine synthase